MKCIREQIAEIDLLQHFGSSGVLLLGFATNYVQGLKP